MWRWLPPLPQPSMGPCFLATLPALQAPLLLSHDPFPIPRCYYCCSTIGSDCCRCVLSPELEQQCSSPLASTAMAHRTLKRNNRVLQVSRVGGQNSSFQFLLRTSTRQRDTNLLSAVWSLFQASLEPTSSLFLQPESPDSLFLQMPVCQQVPSDPTPNLFLVSVKASLQSTKNKTSLR